MVMLRGIDGIDPDAISLARRAYDQNIKDRLRDQIVDLIRNLAPNADREVRRGNETYWRGHGSLKCHHAGPRRGQWIDREAGGKASGAAGGPLDAIKFYAGVENYRDQITWAAHWLGVAPFDVADAIRIDREKIERRIAERRRQAEEAARQQAEQDRLDRESSIKRVRREWSGCVEIAGTPGEVYLRKTRAIPRDIDPLSVRWSNDLRAIAYAIRSSDGEIVAIQYEAITPDGEKDKDRRWRNDPTPRPKDTVGTIREGDAFRLPGPADGPVFIAEGPVTALSAWAAGVEAMAFVGPINLDRIPQLVDKGRRVLIGFEDDPYRGAHSANRKINAMRRRKINAIRRAGFDVVTVLPFETRRERKEDFNDLLRQRGIGAVRDRIAKFATISTASRDKFVDLDAARRNLQQSIGKDMRDLIDWSRSDDAEFAPAVAYRVTCGTGKTDAVLKSLIPILRDMRAKGDGRAIVIAVPFHDLGDDLRGRYDDIVEAEAAALDAVEATIRQSIGGEFVAESYRGREARKPRSPDLMCGNIDTIREAMRLRVDLTKDICKAECPLRDGCDYLAQKTKRADIWIVSHSTLFSKLPAPISNSGGVAMVVVDETPWQSGIAGDAEIMIRTIPDMPIGDGLQDDVDRFAAIRQILLDAVIESGPGPLRASILRRRGFNEESADFALGRERDREIVDGPWRERDPNMTVGPMMRAWSAIRELLASHKEQSGWLRVDADQSGNLILRVRRALSVAKDWRVPSLHLDASLDVELLRHWWPRVEEREPIAVDAPFARVLQVVDRSFAKSQIEPLLGDVKTPDAEKINAARAKERRRIRSFIAARHRENGGDAFVISNKRAIEAMAVDTLPGVEIGHFNGVCGKDGWGRVRSGFVIGRTQPGAGEVERIAEAMTGDVIDPIGSEYVRGDGERLIRRDGEIVRLPCEVDRHPHPIAERVRRRIADEEVAQAVHRARLVTRTPAAPVAIYVLTDVALPMVIDGVIDADAIRYQSPRDLMLAEGGVAFESAATACRAYPKLWDAPDRLRKELSRRRQAEAEKGVARAITVTSSYNKILLGQCHSDPATGSGLIRVEFQRIGPKLHPECAYIDPRRVPDPRAAIEAMIGPLAWFADPRDAADPVAEPIRLPMAVGAEGLIPVDPDPPPASKASPMSHLPPADPLPAQDNAKPEPLQPTRARGAEIVVAVDPGPVVEKVEEEIEPVDPPARAVVKVRPGLWEEVWRHARACGLRHCDVAERVGSSACHLSNVESERRNATTELIAGLERFLAEAKPIQETLF